MIAVVGLLMGCWVLLAYILLELKAIHSTLKAAAPLEAPHEARS